MYAAEVDVSSLTSFSSFATRVPEIFGSCDKSPVILRTLQSPLTAD